MYTGGVHLAVQLACCIARREVACPQQHMQPYQAWRPAATGAPSDKQSSSQGGATSAQQKAAASAPPGKQYSAQHCMGKAQVEHCMPATRLWQGQLTAAPTPLLLYAKQHALQRLVVLEGHFCRADKVLDAIHQL